MRAIFRGIGHKKVAMNNVISGVNLRDVTTQTLDEAGDSDGHGSCLFSPLLQINYLNSISKVQPFLFKSQERLSS